MLCDGTDPRGVANGEKNAGDGGGEKDDGRARLGGFLHPCPCLWLTPPFPRPAVQRACLQESLHMALARWAAPYFEKIGSLHLYKFRDTP